MIRPLPDPRSSSAAATPPRRLEYVPGLLVVRVHEDVARGMPRVAGAGPAALRRIRLPTKVLAPLAALRRRTLREVTPVFSRATHGRPLAKAHTSVQAAFVTSVQDADEADLRGINVLRFSDDAEVERAARELRGSPGIQYAHRVPARWPAARKTTLPANDPLLNRQWGLRAIRWFDLDPLPDARGVRVGVLDTGVDAKHPDLRVSRYAHDRASAEDVVGHGTHVAGIIAARSNNRVSLTGICRCALYAYKIFGDEPAEDGDYYVDEVAYQRALNQARRDGMRVINLSIGGTRFSRTEELLIGRLVDSGCVVVAAMGNEYVEGNPTEYPAAYEGVIAVGASNEANRRAPFSNTGRHIALVAPGTNILSTLPMRTSAYRDEQDTEYNAWSGTSMATPHVTAAAALVLARDPKLSPPEVANLLSHSARKLPGMRKADFTQAYGHGLLDVSAALA
ncbi:MAG TPA: S8 family serine peptidase [Vicinamibacteria bacterium]|nr:S8 family serine peptidase [Vicinamibacteria bacterium]